MDKKNDLLECPRCKSLFDENKYLPRNLGVPCKHIICDFCVKDILKKMRSDTFHFLCPITGCFKQIKPESRYMSKCFSEDIFTMDLIKKAKQELLTLRISDPIELNPNELLHLNKSENDQLVKIPVLLNQNQESLNKNEVEVKIEVQNQNLMQKDKNIIENESLEKKNEENEDLNKFVKKDVKIDEMETNSKESDSKVLKKVFDENDIQNTEILTKNDKTTIEIKVETQNHEKVVKNDDFELLRNKKLEICNNENEKKELNIKADENVIEIEHNEEINNRKDTKLTRLDIDNYGLQNSTFSEVEKTNENKESISQKMIEKETCDKKSDKNTTIPQFEKENIEELTNEKLKQELKTEQDKNLIHFPEISLRKSQLETSDEFLIGLRIKQDEISMLSRTSDIQKVDNSSEKMIKKLSFEKNRLSDLIKTENVEKEIPILSNDQIEVKIDQENAKTDTFIENNNTNEKRASNLSSKNLFLNPEKTTNIKSSIEQLFSASLVQSCYKNIALLIEKTEKQESPYKINHFPKSFEKIESHLRTITIENWFFSRKIVPSFFNNCIQFTRSSTSKGISLHTVMSTSPILKESLFKISLIKYDPSESSHFGFCDKEESLLLQENKMRFNPGRSHCYVTDCYSKFKISANEFSALSWKSSNDSSFQAGDEIYIYVIPAKTIVFYLKRQNISVKYKYFDQYCDIRFFMTIVMRTNVFEYRQLI